MAPQLTVKLTMVADHGSLEQGVSQRKQFSSRVVKSRVSTGRGGTLLTKRVLLDGTRSGLSLVLSRFLARCYWESIHSTRDCREFLSLGVACAAAISSQVSGIFPRRKRGQQQAATGQDPHRFAFHLSVASGAGTSGRLGLVVSVVREVTNPGLLNANPPRLAQTPPPC